MRRSTLALLATLAVACRSAAAPDAGIAPAPVAPAIAVPAPVIAPPASGDFDPSGRWNLVLDVQGQGFEVVLMLVKTPDGGWSGSLNSQMGEAPISKATLEGKKMNLVFAAPGGGDGSMLLTFDGNTVVGEWSAGGMGSKLSGQRP